MIAESIMSLEDCGISVRLRGFCDAYLRGVGSERLYGKMLLIGIAGRSERLRLVGIT